MQAHEHLHTSCSSRLVESVPDIRTKVDLSEIQPLSAQATYGVAMRGGSESGCELFTIDIEASLSQTQNSTLDVLDVLVTEEGNIIAHV